MQQNGAIVAGYDGSAEALAAVRWAAHHANLRDCALHVVHCSLWPLLTRKLGPVPGIADSGLERSAQAILAEGVAAAKAAMPGLEVEGTLFHGLPASYLARISDGQAMVAVGSRGLGGFLGLLVGSVSLELAATATCPVAVIRPDVNPAGPVIVAVDGSGSPTALEDACVMASVSQAALSVIHVQHTPAGYLQKDPTGAPTAQSGAEEVLAAAVIRARALAPGIPVDGAVLVGRSIPHAILTASMHARILVVGTKGHGFLRETIGSTAHAVLHHARGPVLISRRGTEQ
ncbi:universal stress protein [Pseudarthrobacter sp. NPDC058362]|uniref:universal stress protein n=1 Tax=Pseudarthrobacter sp. NPDC058362 TaxID=3346458 RepID=UPI003668954E